MAALNAWNVTDANNNAAPPDGWPEGSMQYSEVNNTGRAVQGTMKRFFADINGSLVAGGVVNAYTVTLNESGYTSYFTGMYFACQIPITNTGATTLNVNGIGAVSVVDRAGAALSSGELQAGGIHEFRYDGTNFQLMGTLVGAAVLNSGVFTNTNAPDLVDTDVALLVGSATPDTSPHIEAGPADIQAKADATTAADLSINSLGGSVNVGPQTGLGNTVLFSDGNDRIVAAAAGVVLIRADGNLSTDSSEIQFQQDNETARGLIGYRTDDLDIRNLVHGARVFLRGEDIGGVLRNGVIVDPDGGVDLHQIGVKRFGTSNNGNVVIFSDGNLDTQSRAVLFSHQNGTQRGFVGHAGTSIIYLANSIHGGNLSLRTANSSGVIRDAIVVDPDDIIEIRHPATNNAVIRTTTPALGGIQVQNLLTGTGFERPLTTSDLDIPAVKTANTARANSTVLVDDPHLSLSLGVGRYLITGVILWNEAAGANQGLRATFSMTTGTGSGSWLYQYRPAATSPSALNEAANTLGGIVNVQLGDSTIRRCQVTCEVNVTVAGSFTFRWAQAVSNANSTTVYANSSLAAKKVA